MSHAVDVEAPYTITVRDVIERSERVAQFPIWAIYLRTDMASGGRAFFAYENTDGGWYWARLCAGGFKSRPADTNYGPGNPRMCEYGHTGFTESTSSGPSFSAGSRLPRDSFSIRALSL